MLENIFGNVNAEKALLHVFHYGEIHATAIAKDWGIALSPIQNQLERFESAGVLVSKKVGRTRVFTFNPKSPFTSPVRNLIKICYESIPIKEKSLIFQKRRRPRSRGKPVL